MSPQRSQPTIPEGHEDPPSQERTSPEATTRPVLSDVTDYVHVLPGRLRIRVGEIYRSPSRCLALKELVEGLDGVASAAPNPRTGMLLVHFDETRASADDITTHVWDRGYLRQPRPRPQPTDALVVCHHCGSPAERPSHAASLWPALDTGTISRKLVGYVASNLLELALKRAFLALI